MQLRLSGIAKRFGSQEALREISLTIDDLHALAIIGPSGGGKTTLLRVIAGLVTPDRGEVEIDGQKLAFDEESLLRHRRSIGTVFQAFNLFPHLTALENITLPLERVHGLSAAEAREEATRILERFHLASHARKMPAQLSGGQQQRVAIARAIAARPALVLADEPTANLDSKTGREILELMADLGSARRLGRPRHGALHPQ